VDIRRRSAASLADRPRRPTKPVAAEAVVTPAAATVMAAEAEVIPRAQPRELPLFALAAASKQPFPLSREAIVQSSVAIASRHKKAAPVAALAVEEAAAVMIAAAVVEAAADATNASHVAPRHC